MAISVAVLASLVTTGCEDNLDWFLDVAGAAGGTSLDGGSSNTSLASNGSGGYTGTVTHSDGTILGTYGDTTSTSNIPGTGSLLAHGPVQASPNFNGGGGGGGGGGYYPTGGTYQPQPMYQNGSGYHGPAYNPNSSPVSVQLGQAPTGYATQPGGSYPRVPSGTYTSQPQGQGTYYPQGQGTYYPNTPQYTGGGQYAGASPGTYTYPQSDPSGPSGQVGSPPAFPQEMAALPQAQPDASTQVIPQAEVSPDPFDTGTGSPDPFATQPQAAPMQGGDSFQSFGGDEQIYEPPAGSLNLQDTNNSVALGGAGANGGMGLGTGGDMGMGGVNDFGIGGGGGLGGGGMGGGMDVSNLS